jgi:SAM-dependent methyltransferase
VTLQKYWDRRAQTGSWSTEMLYEGPVTTNNYNFRTRREAVQTLIADDSRFERVMDLGCGSGDYFEIAALHDAEYHGVDFSLNMARRAMAHVCGRGRGHQVVTAAGDRLPYADGAFDLVLAIGYIEYIGEPSTTLSEIARVLRPGGVLVMQSYKRDLFATLYRFVHSRLRPAYARLVLRQPQRLPMPPRLYSGRGLDRLLAPFGFERTDYRYNNHWVFPQFLLQRWSRAYIRLSELLNRYNSTWSSCLAVNYVARYHLRKPAVADRLRRSSAAS